MPSSNRTPKGKGHASRESGANHTGQAGRSGTAGGSRSPSGAQSAGGSRSPSGPHRPGGSTAGDAHTIDGPNMMVSDNRQVQRARRANVQGNSASSRKQPVLKKRAKAAGGGRALAKKGVKAAAKGAVAKKSAGKGTAAGGKKGSKLSELLTPENVQQSVKTVGSLRSMVKSGLGYLQQADQLLESLYATSSSLKESGVLDKIVKQKGKNLSTEDFTNILMALMSSPIGGQIFKSMGSGSSDAQTASTGEG